MTVDIITWPLHVAAASVRSVVMTNAVGSARRPHTTIFMTAD